mmetsp:Transcript_6515/g.18700  ORF Transcript_6515/g.18700 Transcript_6515/m.18700 type:complete len:285 (+) Transcript_6515:2279-3133(+)
MLSSKHTRGQNRRASDADADAEPSFCCCLHNSSPICFELIFPAEIFRPCILLAFASFPSTKYESTCRIVHNKYFWYRANKCWDSELYWNSTTSLRTFCSRSWTKTRRRDSFISLVVIIVVVVASSCFFCATSRDRRRWFSRLARASFMALIRKRRSASTLPYSPCTFCSKKRRRSFFRRRDLRADSRFRSNRLARFSSVSSGLSAFWSKKAADGKRSWLRAAAASGWIGWRVVPAVVVVEPVPVVAGGNPAAGVCVSALVFAFGFALATGFVGSLTFAVGGRED